MINTISGQIRFAWTHSPLCCTMLSFFLSLLPVFTVSCESAKSFSEECDCLTNGCTVHTQHAASVAQWWKYTYVYSMCDIQYTSTLCPQHITSSTDGPNHRALCQICSWEEWGWGLMQSHVMAELKTCWRTWEEERSRKNKEEDGRNRIRRSEQEMWWWLNWVFCNVATDTHPFTALPPLFFT